MKVLKSIFTSAVMLLALSSQATPASETPGTVVPVGFQVSLDSFWDPSSYTVGPSGSSVSVTAQLSNALYASSISFIPTPIMGMRLYHSGIPYHVTLDIAGEIFSFLVENDMLLGSQMSTALFRFAAQHRFQVGDEIRMSLSFDGASLVGLYSDQDQAFVRFNGNMVAESMTSSVPENGTQALILAGCLMMVFVRGRRSKL